MLIWSLLAIWALGFVAAIVFLYLVIADPRPIKPSLGFLLPVGIVAAALWPIVAIWLLVISFPDVRAMKEHG